MSARTAGPGRAGPVADPGILGLVMSLPRVVAVAPGSPAARAGLAPGDEIVAMGGQVPRDVIQYHLLADEPVLEFELRRGGLELPVTVVREGNEALGIEVDAALFDQVRTCDNHCEFCFIYQLPKGLRKSLYVKDDDYRLSFLYGNFTTLTRFTESDLERVVTEGLSPLWVSIHATDPEIRARMLRNRRGATSLRWLRALLDLGVAVHGQVVVCPGINDGAVLDDTLAGVLDLYPELKSVACVPLGVSKYTTETTMSTHSAAQATETVALIEGWQQTFLSALGRRMVFASDEYYLLTGGPFPPLEQYEDLAQVENGVGIATAFAASFHGAVLEAPHTGGFFQSVDGAPGEGYRAPRAPGSVTLLPRPGAPVTVVTGTYGAAVLAPLVEPLGAQVLPVANSFFGGNIAVAGLLVGEDVAAALAGQPQGRRYLLPDVCLSGGRFLDGLGPEDLPRAVEIVPADGASLRRALRLPGERS
jgi:putative radical SAM enzyme (TIGR03279 family)